MSRLQINRTKNPALTLTYPAAALHDEQPLEASRRDALRLSFLGFPLPLSDLILMNAAQGQQLFFVVDHLFPAQAVEGVIFHQENRFFRAHFLAKAAEDAAKHADFKFAGRFLHVADLRRAAWPRVYGLCAAAPGGGRARLEAVAPPRRLKCPAGLPANGFYAHLGGTLARTESPATPGRRALHVWEWT